MKIFLAIAIEENKERKGCVGFSGGVFCFPRMNMFHRIREKKEENTLILCQFGQVCFGLPVFPEVILKEQYKIIEVCEGFMTC